MSKFPLMLLSDSPNGSSGLGMITRELAGRIQLHLSDVCDVAVAGYGDLGQNRQPFPVYPFSELRDWAPPQLPWIWKQFAGDRKGAILSVWNIAWFVNLAQPENLPAGELRDFLMSGRVKIWSYVPVDSVCLNDRLSAHEERILRRLDRVLAYTKFGADAIDRTLGNPLGTTEHIPHGTDATIFYPRSRKEARDTLLERIGAGKGGEIGDDVIIVGIFATNTSRKDFPLALDVCSRLVKDGHNIGVLIHTNRMVGDWNITELCHGFGLQGRVFQSTKPLADHSDVAWLYAACDVVLANGSGEGHGSPITEAQAMGIPVVHGRYAGGTCHIPQEWTVEPAAYRYEGPFSNKRPVFNADDWADLVEKIWIPNNEPRHSFLPKEMMWDQVWPLWENWFRRGLDEKTMDLERIKRLNYDHHRRMTEDHNRIKAEEKLHPETANTRENLDDKAYRDMLAAVPGGGTWLELGSASGGQWHVLEEWAAGLSGIDLFEPAVLESQKRGLDIHLGFIEKMPFVDEIFSAVVSRHVMEHVADIQVALSEIKRVLRPGGFVAAATPHYFPDVEPAHIQQLHLEAWVKEYEKAGFKIISANLYQCFNLEAHIVAQK